MAKQLIWNEAARMCPKWGVDTRAEAAAATPDAKRHNEAIDNHARRT